MKQFCRLMTILCCLTLCSCSYYRNYTNRESCDKSIKAYNRMLRWQELERAGILYMDYDLMDAFKNTAESIRKRGVSITDYRILALECFPEKDSADVVVEFDYFALPSNRIKTMTYRQNWKYLESGQKTGWQLKSALPEFD